MPSSSRRACFPKSFVVALTLAVPAVVGNPPDQTRETKYSEGRHAGRNGEKDAARPAAASTRRDPFT